MGHANVVGSTSIEGSFDLVYTLLAMHTLLLLFSLVKA